MDRQAGGSGSYTATAGTCSSSCAVEHDCAIMHRALVVVLAASLCLLAAIESGSAAGCHGDQPSYGNPNNFPIMSLSSSNMKLVNTVTNGKAYQVTVPNGGNASSFYITHVWGSPYEMGYAQGQLYGGANGAAVQFISKVWAYLESQVDSVLPHLPVWLQNMIANLGLDLALDATALLTEEYTPEHYYQELHGLADGSGQDYQTLLRVHMIAGLTQGKCSMLGLWGEALDPSSPTKTLQLRALDWDMDGPFRDYSAITVYHPEPGNGHAFASVGMVGFLGGLTGMSEAQLGISEIGVDYPDETFGAESRMGIPFIFVLRDILQFDETLDDAINRLANARRTCDLILGVGDGKLGEFRGFEYSYSVLNVFDDENMMPNASWHVRIPNAVYWGMDWLCPTYNTVLGGQIQKYYGKITPAVAIQYLTAVEMSGDNHLAYYDLTNMQMYVAFAAPHGIGGPEAAYDRQFTQVDVSQLFAEPHPSAPFARLFH